MTAAQMCRLTVVGPQRQVDTAVPAAVPVVDLLPALLGHLGESLADHGLEHGGWVLQRLGEPPLDEDLTPAELRLLNGDVVHLRPRSDLIPPLDFDDLIDGVATGMGQRRGLWRPAFTQRTTMVAAAALLATAVTVSWSGGDLAARVVVSWLSVAGLLGYAFTARGQRRAGQLPLLCSAAALLHGLLGVRLNAEVAEGLGAPAGPAYVVSGVEFATLLTIALIAAFGAGRVLVAGLLWTAVWVLAAIGLFALTGGDLTRVAAALLCLAVICRPMVPRIAFRLAGQELDPLPTGADDLQLRIDPEPGAAVLRATALTDDLMTVLYLDLGLVASLACVVVTLREGWSGVVLAVAASLSQFLSVRPMTSAWHRIVLGVPAVAVLLLVAVVVAARTGPVGPVLIHLALLLTTIGVVGAGRALAEKRITPMPGRYGDVLHYVAGAAMIPCVLWVLGVYSFARNWLA